MKVILVGLLLVLSLVHAEPVPTPAFTLDDLIDILRGIFEAWEINKEEVDKLLICVNDIKDIELEVAKILEELKHIDVKDIVKLIEALVRLFVAVQQIFKDIEPCIDSTGEIVKLVAKLIKLTPMELLMKLFKNIMENGQKIYKDVIAFIEAIKTKNYHDAGFTIGDILWTLFLKETLSSP